MAIHSKLINIDCFHICRTHCYIFELEKCGFFYLMWYYV